MDHVINAIRQYFDIYKSNFIQEWKTGQYKKISDCPSYKEVKALSQSINILSECAYGEKWEQTPKEIIDEAKYLDTI